MLTKSQLEKSFIFDIETVTKYKNYDEMVEKEPILADLWYKRSVKKYYDKHKDILDIDNFIYKEYGGLYPEFSKIICISCSFISFDENNQPIIKTKVLHNENDEKTLLKEFIDLTDKYINKHKSPYIAGHNITAFDIPFICKRTIINGLKLPTLFDISGKKPWEINIIDTLNYWKFTSLDLVSLDLLCYLLNIESPKNGDVNASTLSEMYYSDDENKMIKISEYCKTDSEATAKVMLKFSEI